MWVFFNNNKNNNNKTIGRANLNKFLLREIKVFTCPNIVPPKLGKLLSPFHYLDGQLQVCFVCLFVFSLSIPFFSQTLSREKERDEHKWHKVHKTVKAGKQKLNRSLCSLLTSSNMLLSLSYVVFIELHKTLTSLKLHPILQKIRHHLNEIKRNYNCLSIAFRLTGSKPLKNGSELKKSRAVVIIYNILLTWQNFSLPEFGPGLEWIYPAGTRHVSRIMQLKPRL